MWGGGAEAGFPEGEAALEKLGAARSGVLGR